MISNVESRPTATIVSREDVDASLSRIKQELDIWRTGPGLGDSRFTEDMNNLVADYERLRELERMACFIPLWPPSPSARPEGLDAGLGGKGDDLGDAS